MWAAIPFFASLVLLAAFIAYRNREEKRGTIAFADFRERADKAVMAAYRQAVLGDIPTHFRTALIRFVRQSSHTVVVFAVELLRAVERPLARLSYRMRRDVPAGTGKAPSEFLKTIRPAKKEEDGTTPEGGV